MIIYESHRSQVQESLYHQNDIDLNFSAHLHNSFEFIYVYSGSLELTIDEKIYILKSGDGTIIIPNQIHSYRSIDTSKSYLCVFSNSYIYDFYQKVKDSRATNPVFKLNTAQIVSDLQSPDISRYLIKSYLYYIIDLFNSCTEYEKRNLKLYESINKILSYIENNFTSDITIKNIAKIIGYDYHYLSNLIQKILHTTFRSLLNEYRIQRAQNYLIATSDRITDIATNCGYDSLCSFNRNFKQITTLTPKEYRLAH